MDRLDIMRNDLLPYEEKAQKLCDLLLKIFEDDEKIVLVIQDI